MRETLLADKVRTLNKVAVAVVVGKSELVELAVGLQLGIVAISVGVVQSHVVAPVGRGGKYGREDVVALIEVVGSAVPQTAVVHLVTIGLVVAVGILGECIGIIIEHQALVEIVVAAQAVLVHILIGIDAVGYQCGVVVATRGTAPGLTGLLKVADILVTQSELVAIVGERT